MASIGAPSTLAALPNELILHILQPFPTRDLLPLALVSHRFHALIVRLLQSRLLLAANLTEHTVLLECYPPSQKLTEPAIYTSYVGTPRLDTHLVDPDIIAASPIGRLAELRDLYSSFRPLKDSTERERPQRLTPGDIPGSRTHAAATTAASRSQSPEEHEVVKATVSLEGHELFTQLCAHVTLVRNGPRKGIFRSFVEVDGDVVRVWRNWLNNAAQGTPIEQDTLQYQGSGKRKHTETQCDELQHNNRILWVNPRKHVGIKTKVIERKWNRNIPILFHADEEIPVSYDVEYQELLVRTSHLLLMLERSMTQMESHSEDRLFRMLQLYFRYNY